MSTPSTLFKQLQLAEASYSLFSGNGFVYGNPADLKARLLVENYNAYHGEFSVAQANEFITHWKVMKTKGTGYLLGANWLIFLETDFHSLGVAGRRGAL